MGLSEGEGPSSASDMGVLLEGQCTDDTQHRTQVKEPKTYKAGTKDLSGWLPEWLLGWLFGWLPGWLFGWLLG